VAIIVYKGVEYPVCDKCWERLGPEKSNVQWSSM